MRSRERLDYAGVQARLDAGEADERLRLLQEIVLRDGAYALAYRGPRPIEEANGLEPGQELSVRLVEAEPARRLVRFTPAE